MWYVGTVPVDGNGKVAVFGAGDGKRVSIGKEVIRGKGGVGAGA